MVEATATMPKPATAPQAVQATPNADPSKQSKLGMITAPFQISLLQEGDRWLKFLIYGKHGAGKTELLNTAVDVSGMRDVLFVSAESGEEVLHDSPRIKHPEAIYIVKVHDFTQVARIQEFLKAYCISRDRGDKATMRSLCNRVGFNIPDDKEPPSFKTVILDSLTEIEAYCQYQILGIDENKILLDANDMEVSGWPEFRKNLEMIKLLVRAYRNLPMNVLVACAEGFTQDETKKYHYSPLMTGKLSSQIQGFFDIVGWITVGASTAEQPEAPRRVYVQPISGGPRFDAKNRKAMFKHAFFDNPNMSSIMSDIGLIKA